MSGRGRTDEGSAARLDRLVGRARAALLWERAWPLAWRALGVGLAFLAASCLGLWLDLPPAARMVGVAAFALALVGALVPALRFPRPGRREALARLDRDAGRQGAASEAAAALASHGPASAAEDRLALGADDPGTRALWALHQARAAAAIARLRVAVPRPGMAARDPFALRGVLLVAAAAGLFVAGPEWGERLASAFRWQGPPTAGPNFRIDGWIDPPLYTRMPPLLVSMAPGEQRLRVPVNAQLVVRIAGEGTAAARTSVAPNAGLAALPGAEARADLREERFRVIGPAAEVALTAPDGHRRLVLDVIPDRAPEVRRIGGPEANGRGTFTLTYRAKDDYGIASADGVIEPLTDARTLVPPPRIALALPADAGGEADTKTLVDLTDSPWSGAKVRLTIVVKDEAGQEGRTDRAEITLPGRPFRDSLARALAEERRRLVTGPDAGRPRVQKALDALLVAPETFTPQPSVFLGLRTAADRLRRARGDADLVEVADLLWEMALKIEDGDLSDAEKQLRQAQDRLKEAVERGAPDDEIKRLTQDLKQALDRFLREMAQKQTRQPRDQAGRDRGRPSRTITPEDLDKMLQDMAEAMRRGDTAEAQRLMEQLRDILENLQSAEGGGQSDPSSRAMREGLQELDEMTRDQQGLRDDTHREGQERRGAEQGQRGSRPQKRGQPGQQGRQGTEQGQSGQGQPGQGQPGAEPRGGTGDRQQALRRRLEDLERRMKENGAKGEQGLADAEDAMREAEGAIRGGREGEAVEAQGRALDGLRRGAEGLSRQMQEMAEAEGQGEQEGGREPGRQGQAGTRGDDPLGRPTRGRDMSDGRVRVPTIDESAVQRARRIMEELRRKLGDPSRPREELDYFERLLRRN